MTADEMRILGIARKALVVLQPVLGAYDLAIPPDASLRIDDWSEVGAYVEIDSSVVIAGELAFDLIEGGSEHLGGMILWLRPNHRPCLELYGCYSRDWGKAARHIEQNQLRFARLGDSAVSSAPGS